MKYCLIVDDSSVIRKVARRILEDLKFEIGEAEDGVQAYESCLVRMPDAILLDWSMPNMDGFAFMQALRKLDASKRAKIIFCTTENDVSQIAKAIHCGADDYVLKPFDRTILTSKFAEAGLI